MFTWMSLYLTRIVYFLAQNRGLYGLPTIQMVRNSLKNYTNYSGPRKNKRYLLKDVGTRSNFKGAVFFFKWIGLGYHQVDLKRNFLPFFFFGSWQVPSFSISLMHGLGQGTSSTSNSLESSPSHSLESSHTATGSSHTTPPGPLPHFPQKPRKSPIPPTKKKKNT